MLTIQYRMHEHVMNWSSIELYDGKVVHLCVSEACIVQRTVFCMLKKKNYVLPSLMQNILSRLKPTPVFLDTNFLILKM